VQIKWVKLFHFNKKQNIQYFSGGGHMRKKKTASLDELPVSLNVSDVADVLSICKANAYELCHSENFPSLIIGRRIIVSKYAFIKWMEDLDNFK
jgi:hypothetical protein